MNRKQRDITTWLIATVTIMFLLPFAAVHLASECSGMVFCFMLFFVVNPFYSILLGIRCGKDLHRMWHLPLVNAVAFLSGSWLFFDKTEIWFLVYAAAYLMLGLTAMGISRYFSSRK